jgi:hypothetical protein
MDDKIEKLENDIRSINERVGRLEVTSAVDSIKYASIDSRLTSIEGTLTWLVRLIIGALITALLGFALSGGIQIT